MAAVRKEQREKQVAEEAAPAELVAPPDTPLAAPPGDPSMSKPRASPQLTHATCSCASGLLCLPPASLRCFRAGCVVGSQRSACFLPMPHGARIAREEADALA